MSDEVKEKHNSIAKEWDRIEGDRLLNQNESISERLRRQESERQRRNYVGYDGCDRPVSPNTTGWLSTLPTDKTSTAINIIKVLRSQGYISVFTIERMLEIIDTIKGQL